MKIEGDINTFVGILWYGMKERPLGELIQVVLQMTKNNFNITRTTKMTSSSYLQLMKLGEIESLLT